MIGCERSCQVVVTDPEDHLFKPRSVSTHVTIRDKTVVLSANFKIFTKRSSEVQSLVYIKKSRQSIQPDSTPGLIV